MDEAAIKPKRRLKQSAQTEDIVGAIENELAKPREWWDRWLVHPLSDADFVRAFCEHVFLTTNDHTLRTVRDRAFRFIRQFMNPEMEAELTRYRETHQ